MPDLKHEIDVMHWGKSWNCIEARPGQGLKGLPHRESDYLVRIFATSNRTKGSQTSTDMTLH